MDEFTGFFGDSWDDPKSKAIMALAGGLMGGDWRKGLLDYSSTMSASKEADFKKKMQQAQLDKYAADIDIDKQKLSLDQGKAKRTASMDDMMMGLLRGGGATASPNMPVTGLLESNPAAAATSGDPFAGVNKQALLLDYMQNQGKNMGGWVNDATKPKWENINGNLVNTNAQGFSGGFQAGMKASDNGQVSMWQPDGQGGITVGAPRGALDTFTAYKSAEEAVKNRNATTDYTPPGGNPVRMTREQELRLINGGQPQSNQLSELARIGRESGIKPAQAAPMGQQGYASEGQMKNTVAGNMGADPQALAREIKATAIALQTVPDQKSKQELYGYLQDLQKQAVNLQRQPSLAPTQAPQPSFGLPLQSLSEKERMSAENDAYKTKLVEQAKADVVPTQAKQSNIAAAEGALSLIDKALTHKGLSTSVGVSGKIDPRNYIPGTDAKDFSVLADQLKGTAFLTAFERLKGGGAISEREGEKAQSAIARINTAQSEKEFRAALKDYGDVIKVGVSRIKGEDPKQEPKSLQDYGYKSNDDVLRDARNTLMRNPQARGEVEKRLKAMGLSLGGQ